MRILICDDEKDITDMLERYFVKKGYEVLTANNGEAAIKKAEKIRISFYWILICPILMA